MERARECFMRAVVIVPCFNEAKRLRPDGFLPLCATADLLFVDNGSSDGTGALIEAFCAREPRASLVSLSTNGGKAEAVRQGMLRALAKGAVATGYLDADLATSAEEMGEIVRALDSAEVALGSRIPRLGARIDRTPLRNLLGRGFATLASAALGVSVHDTQCGAKAFRAGPALTAALAEPFHARWAFDVELIGRLLREGVLPGQFIEVPLRSWRDVPGSKLSALDLPRMAIELVRIRAALRKPRP